MSHPVPRFRPACAGLLLSMLMLATIETRAQAAPASSVVKPVCQMPASLDGRRFTNISEAGWRPDNPNAGRMVNLHLRGGRYELTVLGENIIVQGQYHAQRLAENVSLLHMTEEFVGGTARYQLLMTCMTALKGQFIYTQLDGPIAPRQRQNSGQWTLQP